MESNGKPYTEKDQIDWKTPCERCGRESDRVVYGGPKDCDPTIKRYLCKKCDTSNISQT